VKEVSQVRPGPPLALNFHGCSDYVEHFWNATDGEFVPGKVYQHLVTREEAIDYATLREGMVVHRVSPTRELYVVSEAVSEDIDDTILKAKVAELLAAGALLVDNGDGRHSIVVRTYEELVESWGLSNLVDDPKWDEIQRIIETQYRGMCFRELNEYFVANSRMFTAEELAIIANYKRAEAVYYGLFPRKEG
jgi:hypothetical protein